jgi:hypothetical protein
MHILVPAVRAVTLAAASNPQESHRMQFYAIRFSDPAF